MKPREVIPEIVDRANDYVSSEVDYWRREITRPWETGRPDRPAEVGRWIGLGLAVGAVVGGIIAALRVEKPWR